VLFLCGRPGCGRESTATLQIDTPSSTVSLVDPRISRDGVPLCDRHADLTTPPMGWAMNDLRSNRKLTPVPDQNQPTITRTPPRSRPSSGEVHEDTKELKRRRKDPKSVSGSTTPNVEPAVGASVENEDEDSANTVEIKIDLEAMPTLASDEPTPAPVTETGPESRPTRRRDVDEDDDNDKFPWHHQFEDDEPEELQACVVYPPYRWEVLC